MCPLSSSLFLEESAATPSFLISFFVYDESTINSWSCRSASKQSMDGTWKSYADEAIYNILRKLHRGHQEVTIVITIEKVYPEASAGMKQSDAGSDYARGKSPRAFACPRALGQRQ